MMKRLLPYLIVISSLLLAGSISFILTSYIENKQALSFGNRVESFKKEANEVKEIIQPKVTLSPSPQARSKTTQHIVNTPVPTPATEPNISSTPQPTTSPNSTPTQTPSSSPVPQTNQIKVSINGSSNFSVSVDDGANQCDVLNKALADGKISSLNMRYDSNYGTYAVCQINGIGKENSVWWTYTVNGQSPNQGCSYIKAKNGDLVEWKYIGS